MNWDNQDNKDPWGNQGDAPDFDELMKKFSAILGGKKSSSNNGSGGNNSGFTMPTGRIMLYALFGLLVLAGFQSIYIVEEQERAVILRLGKFNEEQQPGLNFKIPLIDQKFEENVTITRRESQSVSMLTKDENIVDVTVSAQYRIANLKDFVLNVKDPENSLKQALDSALRHVVGDFTLDQTLTVGRENIAQEVQERMQAYLNIYSTGLLVQQVNIEKTDPPSAVKDAFDDVVAQARIREAEGYKLEVVANAEGEVDRFNKLLEEYKKAPIVTRDRLYLDALQSVLSNSTKVMVDVEGGNNLLYLPLDKIMEENKKRGDDDE